MSEQTLKRGSERPEVTDLQERLIELRLKPGEVDGIFGVLTESAVKMCQISVNDASDKLDEVAAQQTEGAAG